MGKAHPSSHGRSYIPNTMFLWLIIQLTIKTAHKLLNLTHRNCWGKPNMWILPPLLQKNKYGRSQLYRDQIFSHTIYLYNRKFDWCLIVHRIWLVWHTYISHWSTHWSTHWTAHNIPDAPTKRYFFYKKITQQNTEASLASLSWLVPGDDRVVRHICIRCIAWKLEQLLWYLKILSNCTRLQVKARRILREYQT